MSRRRAARAAGADITMMMAQAVTYYEPGGDTVAGAVTARCCQSDSGTGGPEPGSPAVPPGRAGAPAPATEARDRG